MIGQRGEGRSASAHNPFTYSIPSYPIYEFLYIYIYRCCHRRGSWPSDRFLEAAIESPVGNEVGEVEET